MKMTTQGEVLRYLYQHKNEWISLDDLRKIFNNKVGLKLIKLLNYDLVERKYTKEKRYIERPTTKDYTAYVCRVYYRFKKF